MNIIQHSAAVLFFPLFFNYNHIQEVIPYMVLFLRKILCKNVTLLCLWAPVQTVRGGRSRDIMLARNRVEWDWIRLKELMIFLSRSSAVSDPQTTRRTVAQPLRASVGFPQAMIPLHSIHHPPVPPALLRTSSQKGWMCVRCVSRVWR